MRLLQYKSPNNQQYKELRINNLSGGLNLKYIESQIVDNQSPEIINLTSDDLGNLKKRNGWTSLFSALTDEITAITFYKNRYVFSAGTKIYKLASTDLTPVTIMTGITEAKGTFFEFNGILYYINGYNYIQYNATTCTNVTPYIPTTYINRLPSGGGDSFENINRIGSGFTNTFNSDGIATLYYLTETSLDPDIVIVKINGVTKTEDVHFTVNRINGTVDFTGGSSPHGAPTSGTNNIIITAYKTNSTSLTSIKSNLYITSYGGENDTRVFLCGYGNYVFYSALLDPTYFPYNNYNRIGDPNVSCTGFSKMYDILVVFKPKEIYSMTYLNENSIVSFPTKIINSTIGCDMPRSIQIINDNPVFANTLNGVYVLFSSGNIKEEKNVKLISDNINGNTERQGLLSNTNTALSNCSSIDFDKKYWLCIGNVVYVWDYNINQFTGLDNGGQNLSWFYYTNINSNCFTINTDHNLLAFGDRTIGTIKVFDNQLNDDGIEIQASFKSKVFDFKYNDYLKNIIKLWLTTKVFNFNIFTISYITEKQIIENATTIQTDKSFDWNNFIWDDFTWSVYSYAITIKKDIKLKNVQYFQIKIENNEIDKDLSLINLIIQFQIANRIK